MGDWGFADWNFGRAWDTILEDTKRFKHGFYDVIDTEECFLNAFNEMRAKRIIPSS